MPPNTASSNPVLHTFVGDSKPPSPHVAEVTNALLEILSETRRGSPALLKLVNSVRSLLHEAGHLTPEAEANFQSFRGVFGGFHGAASLPPLPVAPLELPTPDPVAAPEPPDTVLEPVPPVPEPQQATDPVLAGESLVTHVVAAAEPAPAAVVSAYIPGIGGTTDATTIANWQASAAGSPPKESAVLAPAATVTDDDVHAQSKPAPEVEPAAAT